MKPARFAYRRAHSGEALEWLADEGRESKILAGGQSLVPLMNMRLARSSVLVDVNPVPELRTIVVDDGGLSLGAMVRHSDLIESALVSERAPLLVEAARHIGHRAIRNLGTLGGSLAHADAPPPVQRRARSCASNLTDTSARRWVIHRPGRDTRRSSPRSWRVERHILRR